MVETHDHFVNRLEALGKKHQQMTQGYTTKVGKDGLIVVRPKRRARNATGLKFVLLAAFLFFTLKVLLVASSGSASYVEDLNVLAEGTAAERVGAYLMQIDPVTKAVADYVSPVVRGALN